MCDRLCSVISLYTIPILRLKRIHSSKNMVSAEPLLFGQKILFRTKPNKIKTISLDICGQQ